MPLELLRDERLREKGWMVFRSSSRDRMVPSTSGARTLTRVKIGEAYPVEGVGVGEGALAEAERAKIMDSRQRVVDQVNKLAMEKATGETIVMNASVDNPTANPGPAGNIVDDVLLIGAAPFSGFITEVSYRDYLAGGSISYVAIRTGSGASVFQGGLTFAFGTENIPTVPDFAVVVGGDPNSTSRRMRVPVLSGEAIFVIVRTDRLLVANSVSINILLTFESAEGAPLGARAAVSALGANRTAIAAATKEAFIAQRALTIEQERTNRTLELERLKIERAKIEASARRPAGVPMLNPFQQVLIAPGAQSTIRARAPVKPPPPPFETADNKQLDGKGKTFVPSWMPTNNGVGYLIPDPPRGGKVNVFGDEYTVWSASGQQVSRGKIEVVQRDQNIPEEARLSTNRGGSFPGDQSLTPRELQALLNPGG